MFSTSQIKRNQIYLFFILFSAFLLRIWGVDFGLPHIYHTDEWFEVKRALKLGAGIIDFERVGKGGYFYLLFVEYGIYFVILKLLGTVKSSSDFLLKFFQDPTNIWMIGRVTTVILGTVNCYFIYLLGKHAFSRGAGLFAALLMAVHVIHVQSSHYITVDVPLTMLITVCFLIMCWRGANPEFTGIHYSLLGVAVALALMTKITAGPLLLSILVFHFANVRTESGKISVRSLFVDRRLLFFSLLFPLVYILGEPGILFQYKNVINYALSFLKLSGESGGSGNSLMWPIFPRSISPGAYYLNVLFPIKYIFLTLAILSGFLLSTKKNVSKSILFLSFLLPYFFFVSASSTPEHMFHRYTLPMLPILFLFAGYSLDYFMNKIAMNYGKVIFAAIMIVGLFPLLKDSISDDIHKSKTDTRTIAKMWVDENIPSDRGIYIEGGYSSSSSMTVPLDMNPDRIDEIFAKYVPDEKMSQEKSKFYQIKMEALKTKKTHYLIPISDYDQRMLSDALDNKYGEYVILRDRTKAKFSHDTNRENFPATWRLISWVDSGEFELVKVFDGNEKVVGPKILVYKRQR